MNPIPNHVAIIMDGNGRWAKERGMVRLQGHNAGMEAFIKIVEHSNDIGVNYLTVYAFSTENWKRPADEVNGLFKILIVYINREIKRLHEKNVKLQIMGDYKALPKDSVEAAEYAINLTKDNTGLVLNILLNYGGRDEIARAAKKAAEMAKNGLLDPSEITEDKLNEFMYKPEIPDPELIIRTGGEYRLSNFLTWQSAYSELVFVDTYWPDFTPEEYDKAIMIYRERDRRFGGVK